LVVARVSESRAERGAQRFPESDDSGAHTDETAQRHDGGQREGNGLFEHRGTFLIAPQPHGGGNGSATHR
jgi:hypothetical protein